MTNAAAQSELPKYVGYAEIAAATGMDKRQIQRLMARGKFPKPDGIPTKENRWRLSVILEWLAARNAEQIAAISDLAVTDPAKLKPEQLEEALSGAAAELARRAGIDLPPGSHVSVNVPLTAEQTEKRLSAANGALADAFGRLDVTRGCLVVGGLIPALRPITDGMLENMHGMKPSETQSELRALAVDILDQAITGEFVGVDIDSRLKSESA
jgi:predicted DNA-binding transcriptional regulator AlpA